MNSPKFPSQQSSTSSSSTTTTSMSTTMIEISKKLNLFDSKTIELLLNFISVELKSTSRISIDEFAKLLVNQKFDANIVRKMLNPFKSQKYFFFFFFLNCYFILCLLKNLWFMFVFSLFFFLQKTKIAKIIGRMVWRQCKNEI